MSRTSWAAAFGGVAILFVLVGAIAIAGEAPKAGCWASLEAEFGGRAASPRDVVTTVAELAQLDSSRLVTNHDKTLAATLAAAARSATVAEETTDRVVLTARDTDGALQAEFTVTRAGTEWVLQGWSLLVPAEFCQRG